MRRLLLPLLAVVMLLCTGCSAKKKSVAGAESEEVKASASLYARMRDSLSSDLVLELDSLTFTADADTAGATESAPRARLRVTARKAVLRHSRERLTQTDVATRDSVSAGAQRSVSQTMSVTPERPLSRRCWLLLPGAILLTICIILKIRKKC